MMGSLILNICWSILYLSTILFFCSPRGFRDQMIVGWFSLAVLCRVTEFTCRSLVLDTIWWAYSAHLIIYQIWSFDTGTCRGEVRTDILSCNLVPLQVTSSSNVKSGGHIFGNVGVSWWWSFSERWYYRRDNCLILWDFLSLHVFWKKNPFQR